MRKIQYLIDTDNLQLGLVEYNLIKINGIKACTVNYEDGILKIIYDNNILSKSYIINILYDLNVNLQIEFDDESDIVDLKKKVKKKIK